MFDKYVLLRGLFSAAIVFLTALLAQLVEMASNGKTLGDLDSMALAVMGIGALLGLLKDIYSSMQPPPAAKSASVLMVLALFGLLLVMPGCTYLKDSVAEATGQAPAKTLQQRIDDAKILVVAASDEIADGVVAGYVLVDEAQAQLNRVNDANEQITQAQTLLRLGDPTSAEGQLAIANTALDLLRKEIARKAREAKQQ